MLCKERGLDVYFRKENLSIFDSTGKEHPFLTIFIAILGTVAAMERENISFRLQSGKAQYMAKGGKVGRKTGYRKPEEDKRKQYAGVLRLSDEDDSRYRGSKCKYGPEIEEGIWAVEVKGDCDVTVSLSFFLPGKNAPKVHQKTGNNLSLYLPKSNPLENNKEELPDSTPVESPSSHC